VISFLFSPQLIFLAAVFTFASDSYNVLDVTVFDPSLNRVLILHGMFCPRA